MANWQFCLIMASLFGISADQAWERKRELVSIVDGILALCFSVAALVFLVTS